MHQTCKMFVRTMLEHLDGTLLEFTPKPGVLRCLKPGEELSRAQGLYFQCPKCRNTGADHGFTVLFDLPSVPEKAAPPGRWQLAGVQPLDNLTLHGAKIQSPTGCGVEGQVASGKFRWRC